MDKDATKIIIKRVLSDRAFLFVMAALVVVGMMYCLMAGLNIRVSEITVYTRYTAFGGVHFYKSPWQYFFVFVAFGFIVTIAHGMLMLKLHSLDKRYAGMLVGVFGVTLLLIALVYTLCVMSLGRAV